MSACAFLIDLICSVRKLCVKLKTSADSVLVLYGAALLLLFRKRLSGGERQRSFGPLVWEREDTVTRRKVRLDEKTKLSV